ncbi:hypothetical protein ASD08_15940 [Streptomyces sp. Root369]|nr:hypothetical protein ASD08_15940 [Streptomyces sp. Root369]
MRLHFAHPRVRRTWTVELRPQPGGPVLVCRHCAHNNRPVNGPSARAELLAHLASHARWDRVPPHLRTCQCHERGCEWHPRHRGCHGPIRLLLTRKPGGRIWRLADACTACAAATSHAAVVPETILATRASPCGRANSSRKRRHPKGPDSRTRVREMLNYLATALPAETGAAARLIALQCALRMNDAAQVTLPFGVLRGLRLAPAAASWDELRQARWLQTAPPACQGVRVQILDAGLLAQHPARPDRLQAADWALRTASQVRADPTPLQQLAALSLATRITRENDHGSAEADLMAREFGSEVVILPLLLDQLVTKGLLAAWAITQETGDLHWTMETNDHALDLKD